MASVTISYPSCSANKCVVRNGKST
ncbi:IS1 family transposase, partial [Escherichia coli]